VKTYAEGRIFRDHHYATYSRAKDFVQRVSPTRGKELRCHELARAVLECLGAKAYDMGVSLDVVDGKCGPVEHSWICFLADGVVLDVYAPGREPPVQLVDPLIGFYKPGERRTDISESYVVELVREMRGQL
jgi:hypothetical protein